MKEALRAVEKKKAYEDIVQQILSLIERGVLKQGDRFPAERALTEILNVSRTTVREAIRALEAMKLIQCHHGNGTYVIATVKEVAITPLAAGLFKMNDELREIFYVRKTIESHVAALAAENATPQEIEELERILREQKLCIERGESVFGTDWRFHNRLAEATRNRVIVRLLVALVDFLRKSREIYLVEDVRDLRAKKSLEGHRRVFAAVKKGDRDAAFQSMLQHLEDVEELSLHVLSTGT